jgi:hypothetical protein
MKKQIAYILLIIVILFVNPSAFAMEPLPTPEPDNYCKDKKSWAEWDSLVQKYPLDPDVQILHALRIGFCMKIEQGSISFEMARDLFSRAHQMVIQKKFYKQNEEKEKEL